VRTASVALLTSGFGSARYFLWDSVPGAGRYHDGNQSSRVFGSPSLGSLARPKHHHHSQQPIEKFWQVRDELQIRH
jgi:hypothetical protein